MMTMCGLINGLLLWRSLAEHLPSFTALTLGPIYRFIPER